MEATWFPRQLRSSPHPHLLGPPISRRFFQPAPIETKSVISGAAQPISVSQGRPPCAASGREAIASKRGILPTRAAAHRRGSQRGVKCSLDAPTGPICISPVSFLLFPRFLSLFPLPAHSPLRFETRCLKHEVGQTSVKSCSPLSREKGGGREHLLRAFCVQMCLHGHLIDSS